MLFIMQFVVFQICYPHPCKQTKGGGTIKHEEAISIMFK